MELTYECPTRHAVGRVASLESSRSALQDDGRIARGWCSTIDLHVEKDFSHVLGLVGLEIVTAGFVASSVFWYLYRPLSALGVLLATASLGLVPCYRVPVVAIRQRDFGQHRGPGINPDGRHARFDLAIGERDRRRNRREAAGPAHPS